MHFIFSRGIGVSQMPPLPESSTCSWRIGLLYSSHILIQLHSFRHLLLDLCMDKTRNNKTNRILFLLYLKQTVLRNMVNFSQPHSTINQEKPWEVVDLPKNHFGHSGKLLGHCCHFFGSADSLDSVKCNWNMLVLLKPLKKRYLSFWKTCNLLFQMREAEINERRICLFCSVLFRDAVATQG